MPDGNTYVEEKMIKMLKQQIISRDAFITSSSNIVASVIYIFTAFLATKILGPYHKGVYTLFITFCSILIIVSNLSINSSASYFASKNKNDSGRIFKDLIILSFATSLIGITICNLSFLLLKDSLFKGADTLFFIISNFTIASGIFLTNSDTFLLGIDRIRAYGLVTLVKAFLNLLIVAVLILLLKGQSLGAVAAYTTSILLSAIIATWLAYRNSHKSNSQSYIKKITSFGAKIHPTNLISIIEQRIDIILVGLMIGPSAAGLYSLATAFAEAGLIIPNSLSLLIIPKTANAGKTPGKIIKFSLFFTIIYAIIVFLSCQFLIEKFFGQIFFESITPTKILAIGVIFFGIRKTLIHLAFGKNSTKKPLIIMLISLIVNFTLNIFLIPKLQITGAALSSLITYSISAALIFIMIKKRPRM